MGTRSSVMVGRDSELSLLQAAFRRADAGEAQLVLVTGEAGIGKTRLVRELVTELPEHALAAYGHAVPVSGGAMPYGVVADLLRSLTRVAGAEVVRSVLGSRTAVLAPLVPRLGEGSERPVDRLALGAVTRDLLEELSVDRPVVLLVEDGHWADESSLDMLAVWARTLVAGRLLLLATTRVTGVDDRVLEWTNALGRLPNAEVVALGALGEIEILEQLRNIDAEVSPKAVSEIQRLSDGVPLYVEELLAARGAALPSVVRTDMAGRLRGLGDGASGLLQVAAVEPRPFTVRSLAAVASADIAAVESAVDAAAAAGLLDPVGERWRFAHELLRLGAMAALPPSSRLRAHAGWADHLSSSATADDLVTAAMHRAEIGPSRETFLGFVRAARAAAALAPGRETLLLWRRALEVIRDAPGSASEDEHDEVLGIAATMFNTVMDYWDLADIEEGSASAPTELRRAFIRLCRAGVAITLPGAPAADTSLDELVEIGRQLEHEPPTTLGFATSQLLVDVLDLMGHLSERDRLIKVLETYAAALPDLGSGLDWVLEWRIASLTGMDREAERVALARSAVHDSRDRDWATRSWTHGVLSYELRMAADLAGAYQESGRSLELVSSVTEVHWYFSAMCRIDVLHLDGHWDDALLLVDLLRTRGTLDAHWWLGTTYRSLIASARGQDEVESATVDELLHNRFPPGPDKHSGESSFLAALAWAVSRPADADAIDSLMAALDAIDPRYGWLYADAVVFLAHRAWATELISGSRRDRLWSTLEHLDDTSLHRLYAAEVRAHLGRAEGEDSAEAWRAVVDGWERAGAPFHAAQARTRLAEALLAGADRTGATDALGPALASAEQLGAVPLADEIRILASRARLRLAGHEPAKAGVTGPLTAREHEVLQLLVQGMTNDQIGSALFMSPRTASVHVSHILAKLGAANRTEVTAVAHRKGLVT